MKAGDPQMYIDGVLAQDRRVIAKTITLIESSLPAHQEAAQKIMDALLSHTGTAIRMGITGVPGVGKSTFIDALGEHLIQKGHRLAVLAVDPSSSISGGSVMADKTRMEKVSAEKQAFVRPSPSGGTLGGVAQKTRETMLVCEAAGYDVIIIETVGIGQSESKVASMVDFFMVLMLAGAGDELQGIKRGILELADAIAVNKADGDNVNHARKAAKIFETALHLLHPPSSLWTPPVLTCSALELSGIEEIWRTVLKHRKTMSEHGELDRRRRNQAKDWMWSLIEEGLKEQFYRHPEMKKRLAHITQAVEKGEIAPRHGARELLSSIQSSRRG
jgi:LAO/AO transport system kinase